MGRVHAGKADRHQLLNKYLIGNPFLTDDDLAHLLGVSIQTVRLDRGELHIPELRERMKEVAKGARGQIRTISGGELVGELVDLEMGKSAVSLLMVKESMTLVKTGVVRGHYLFAQANSLAVAIIDSEVALTGTSKISFKRPVYQGEKIVARAVVSQKKGNKYMVRVSSKVHDELVFQGKFLVFAIAEEVWRR